MFQRFTERARQVVVLAQDEARALEHGYIGTEHLLLGLLREEEGIAARVLASLGIRLEEVRAHVRRIVGQGDAPPAGRLPFTPRSKKVLDLSLREALQLGHDWIGTEHLLLGLVRENYGVACQILLDLGADDERIRNAVLAQFEGSTERAGGESPAVTAEVVARRARERPVPPAARRARRGARGGGLRVHAQTVLALVIAAAAFPLGLLVGWLIWG